jgi:pyrimidine operon attenuation protein/uracil phosphoribosyltransferase
VPYSATRDHSGTLRTLSRNVPKSALKISPLLRDSPETVPALSRTDSRLVCRGRDHLRRTRCVLRSHTRRSASRTPAAGAQINRDVVEGLQIPALVVDAVAAQEQEELARRQHAYRDDLLSPNVKGKTVILVDDGIATGSTIIPAVAALRQLNAIRIVVAVLVIARSTFYQIYNAHDDVATIIAPGELYPVG